MKTNSNHTSPQTRTMISQIIMALALAGLTLCCGLMFVRTGAAQTAARKEAAAFSFANVSYFHRFSQGEQHEYTPAGQEDLQAWTDMITLRSYRAAKTAEALAATANTVLTNYKNNQAVIVKTNSVPRTKAKPAEHLIVALFPRPKFIEAVFARFQMQNGSGTAVIYSHRIYGEKAGNTMSAWLEKNGATTETNLMQWNAAGKLPAPK